LRALVMMAGDMESGGEILRHRRDRTGDFLIVVGVRALSEHRPDSRFVCQREGEAILEAAIRSGKRRDHGEAKFRLVWHSIDD
jgi:hypothetical protein